MRVGSTRRWRTTAAVVALCTATLAIAGVAVARWVQEVPISSETVRTGTLELTAEITGSVTVPVTITPSLQTATTERVPLTIGNAGNVPLDYRLADVTWSGEPGSGTAALVPTLAPATSSTACLAGTAGTAITLTTGGTQVVSGSMFVARRPLAAGSSEVLCLSLTVPSALTAEFATGSPTITLTFDGQNQ